MKLLHFILAVIFSGAMNAQNAEATLFFNDGTSLEGYAALYKSDQIKFRINRDDEPDIWTDLMVDKVIFYGFETSDVFEYVVLNPNEPAQLLEVLVDEETKLYSDVITSTYYSNTGMRNGLPTGVSRQKSTFTKLYVQKEEEEFPLALTGNFRRKAKQYFSDCDILVKKLNRGEFGKPNAKDMIYYYIDYCGEY